MKKLFNKLFFGFDKSEINPLQITIDISGSCNAQCPFCARQLFNFSQNNFMPAEMFYNIIEQVKTMPSIKIISLAALGEPLLHPNFDEFVEHLVNEGYKVVFPTNMSLAHKHFDTLLKATQIVFSIEGENKENYEKYRKNLNFEQVLNNIIQLDNLIKEKKVKGKKVPSRGINYLVTKKSNIQEFINQWEKYIDIIKIYPMGNPHKWNSIQGCFIPTEIETLKDEIIPKTKKTKKLECTDPFELIVINPFGKLALCCSDTGCTLDFGNYKNIKDSFYNNKNLNKIRSEIRKNKPIVCKNCFQNYELSKEILEKYLPELGKLDSKKTKVF